MEHIEYLAPRKLDETLKVVEKTPGETQFIAGGTNVIPNMRSGKISPKILIDLSRLEGLDYIREENNLIAVGSLTTISEIAASDLIRRHAPVLSSAAGKLGNPLTRNRATIGGNLADASPAADMAPPLLSLEAIVHTKASGGEERQIPLDKFFLGPNKTALDKNEIIVQIVFIKPKDAAKGHYFKLGLRNSMAISVASISLMLELKGKVCLKARIAVGAVAPTPVRIRKVEKNLEGKEINDKIIQECSALVREEIMPISDIRASAAYRNWVTPVLIGRAIQEVIKGDLS